MAMFYSNEVFKVSMAILISLLLILIDFLGLYRSLHSMNIDWFFDVTIVPSVLVALYLSIDYQGAGLAPMARTWATIAMGSVNVIMTVISVWLVGGYLIFDLCYHSQK